MAGLSVYPDELLSSVLMRAAHARGIGALPLAHRLIGRMPLWNRDLDRTTSTALIEGLAVALDCDPTRLKETLLIPTANVAPRTHLRMVPWITPVGVFHCARGRFGLQYCPVCLSERPYFRRMWRLAFITACADHRVQLRDACPSCRSPIILHRQRFTLSRCTCGAFLDRRLPGDHAAELPLLARQLTSDWQALTASPPAEQTMAGIGDLVNGWHTIVRWMVIVRRHTRTERTRAERFEFLRTAERHRWLVGLERMRRQWPTSLIRTAASVGLTQRSFQGLQQPSWLAEVIQLLPDGIRHDRGGRSRLLRQQLRRVHRSKDPGWRSERVLLLGRAVRG